jgi:hypothetical protein
MKPYIDLIYVKWIWYVLFIRFVLYNWTQNTTKRETWTPTKTRGWNRKLAANSWVPHFDLYEWCSIFQYNTKQNISTYVCILQSRLKREKNRDSGQRLLVQNANLKHCHKTDSYDVTKIVLKVSFNTHNPSI